MSAERALAVARAWGLDVGVAAAVALAVVALVAGDTYVELPIVQNRTTMVHSLPVLTAMALGYPMVDRWPELTLVTGRSPVRLFVLRLLAVVAVSLPVLLALLAVGWTVGGAAVVPGFVGVAAVLVAVLGIWYWVPMFGVLVAWVQLRPSYLAVAAGADWLALSAAALVLGGGCYVAAEGWRVRRVVRALDTIRP